jgi:hypothetical protein
MLLMRTIVAAAAVAFLGSAIAGTAAQAQDVGGSYQVAGTNFDGSPYGGTATITPSSNSTCRIVWKTGGTTSTGFCMLSNSSLAAAYKLNNSVGLVLYDLQSDGTLKGVWTIADKSGAGTETLTPAK